MAIARQIGDRVAFVGASMGGSNALDAIMEGFPAAALILVDIVPRPEDDGVARILSFMRGHPDGFSTIEQAAEAVASYNPSRARPKSSEGLRRNLRQRADGRYFWHWDPKMLEIDVADEQDRFDIRLKATAPGITTPILVVRGFRSDVVSDASIAAFRQIIPAVEVYDVNDAGHMIAGDQNDAFNASVIAFLERHMPVGSGSG
jgi:pimeloyl-ACP methyl ester carboxylesterase